MNTSTTTPQQHSDMETVKVKAGRIYVVFPWILVVFLLILNGATVIDERVHLAAYGVIADMVGFAGNTVSQAVLRRSPTTVQARVVERATKELKLKNVELSARYSSLVIENGKLQTSKITLTKERDNLRALSARRAADVKNLSIRTASKLAARASKTITSMPMRAVPYAGIAALVTFTAIEMKEDCDLVRSLDVLNKDHENEPIDTNLICSYADKVPTMNDTWNQVKSKANGFLKNAYGVIERAKP